MGERGIGIMELKESTRWLNSDPLFLQHLAQIMGIVVTPHAHCLAEFRGTVPVAGAIFDGYNGQSIHAHVWIPEGCRPSRLWWWACHDYMFNQLKVTNVIGTVPSSNKAAQKLDEHIGFKLHARVPAYYPDGDDMLLYICTKDTAYDYEKFRPRNLPFQLPTHSEIEA